MKWFLILIFKNLDVDLVLPDVAAGITATAKITRHKTLQSKHHDHAILQTINFILCSCNIIFALKQPQTTESNVVELFT